MCVFWSTCENSFYEIQLYSQTVFQVPFPSDSIPRCRFRSPAASALQITIDQELLSLSILSFFPSVLAHHCCSCSNFVSVWFDLQQTIIIATWNLNHNHTSLPLSHYFPSSIFLPRQGRVQVRRLSCKMQGALGVTDSAATVIVRPGAADDFVPFLFSTFSFSSTSVAVFALRTHSIFATHFKTKCVFAIGLDFATSTGTPTLAPAPRVVAREKEKTRSNATFPEYSSPAPVSRAVGVSISATVFGCSLELEKASRATYNNLYVGRGKLCSHRISNLSQPFAIKAFRTSYGREIKKSNVEKNQEAVKIKLQIWKGEPN